MKRILLLALIPCILSACKLGHDRNDNHLKIGSIVELTGTVPAIGASSKNAAELAVKEVNAQGGILVQGKKIPVDLIIEDNANQADQSAASTQKLISDENVLAIVGPNASLGAVPAAEIAEHEKTVLITPWSTNPKVTINNTTGAPKQYVFRACFIDSFEGQVLARFARENLKYKTAAVLYDIASEAPNSQAKFFIENFTKRGGKITSAETYTSNDKDFTAQLTKIKEGNPDVIFLPAYYNDVPLITQQARRLGIQAPFLGSDAWSNPELISLSNGTVEGAYFVNHYSAESKNTATQQFVHNYQKAYGQTPDDIAALTYDAYQVLFRAIAASKQLDRDSIRNSVANIKPLQGVTGTIQYKNNSGDPVKSAVIMQIKGNQFTWVADGKA